MTRETKDLTSWYQATQKTSKSTSNPPRLTARFKAAIVTLTLWGLVPVSMADWIIHRGGLSDD